MKNQDNQYTDYIEDFLSGKLSAEEEEAFRIALESNPVLEEAFRFRTKIAQYWNEEEKYSATKDRVKAIMASHKRPSVFKVKHFYLAASVVLLIGVSVVLWRVISPDNSIKDFASLADSTDQHKQPVSVLEQPERGSLYMVNEEYTTQDSLILTRMSDWPESGRLVIAPEGEQAVIESYAIDESTDSLIVQLNHFTPGTYQWTIRGKDICGIFTVIEIHD